MIFSNSFPRHSSSVIGRYDLGEEGSFLLGLRIMHTVDMRQTSGWCPRVRHLSSSLCRREACDFQTALSRWYPMPEGPDADVLEVVLSAKSISPLVIAGHLISCLGVTRGSSGSKGGGGKKVVQKSSALLWLSFAIVSPVFRAGVGV